METQKNAAFVLPEGWKKCRITPVSENKEKTIRFTKLEPGWKGELEWIERKEAGSCPASSLQLAQDMLKKLPPNAALLDAEVLQTDNGIPCFFVLIKQKTAGKKKEAALVYGLTMVFFYPEKTEIITGSFAETGNTGIREASVFEKMKQQYPPEEIKKRWLLDPYQIGSGIRLHMNQSERAELDEKFPFHPLTQARKFAAEMTRLN